MTRKEKLRLDHPDWSENQFRRIFRDSCPSEYGFEEMDEYCVVACAECWNKEIPETKPTEKENDIMPINVAATREVTKADLIKEIEFARNHISEMEIELKKLEQYKKNVAIANEMKAIHNSLVEVGFTDEQAFELMKCALQAAAMGGARA